MFNARYPPILSSTDHLQYHGYRSSSSSSSKQKKTTSRSRPTIPLRKKIDTDQKIRDAFSKIGHSSPYYPSPVRLNVRKDRMRKEVPPGRTRRRAPRYGKRAIDDALLPSSSEFLSESFPNFRSEPDMEVSPSIADEKVETDFIDSAPLSLNPMSVHSAETPERIHEGVRRYQRDTRMIAGTPTKSTTHTEESHGRLTPVKILKEHRASKVVSPSENSAPLWFGSARTAVDRFKQHRRSHNSIASGPPTPFDFKEDEEDIVCPSPAIIPHHRYSLQARQNRESLLRSISPHTPYVPFSSHELLTPIIAEENSSHYRGSTISVSPSRMTTTTAARRSSRLSFNTPQDMEAIRNLYRACQRLEEENHEDDDASDVVVPSRSTSTSRKTRLKSVTQLSASTRRRTHSTETPLIADISSKPSEKFSKAESPTVVKKHIFTRTEAVSNKYQFNDDDHYVERLIHDFHDKKHTKPISRRGSYPESPGTRKQKSSSLIPDTVGSERLSVTAASRGSVITVTNSDTGGITSLPHPRKTSADNVELPEEEADSPSVWLRPRAGTARGHLKKNSSTSPPMPPSTPPPPAPAVTPEEEKKEKKKKSLLDMTPREATIEEILSTEIKYVKTLENLKSILSGYFKNKTSGAATILAKEALQEISQLTVLAKSLLPKLQVEEKKNDSARRIGKVFETFGHFFKMYDRYMQKCEDFMKFFDRALESEPSKQSEMSSLLIAPVQRIPRYELLLRDLFKRTEKTHVDYSSIERALNIVKGSTGQIDHHMEEQSQKDQYRSKFYKRFRNTYVKDQTTCVPELRMPFDPNRCLIKEGKLNKVNRKGRTNTMEFFLLGHLLCYAAEGAGRLTRAMPLGTLM